MPFLAPGHQNLDELTFDLSLTFTLYFPYKKVRLRSKVSSIALGLDDENLMKLIKVSCLRIKAGLRSFIVKAFRFLLEFIRVAL